MSRVLPARPITLTSAASGSYTGGWQTASVVEARPAADFHYDTPERGREGVFIRSELASGVSSSASLTAGHAASGYRRAEVLGSSVRVSAAPSSAASVAASTGSSFVPRPGRGASATLAVGLSQSSTVAAVTEARVLQTGTVGQLSPRLPTRLVSAGQGVSVKVRAASPGRAVSLAGSAVPAEPQAQAAAAASGRALTRAELMRTGRLMNGQAEALPAAQPVAAMPAAAGRPSSASAVSAVQQFAEPLATPHGAASGSGGRPEGPDFGPRWAQVISRSPAQQVAPAEPLAWPAEPLAVRLQGATIQLESVQRQAQPASASGMLSPQSVGSASIAASFAAQAGAAPTAAAAGLLLEGLPAGQRTGVATPVLTSAAEARLREELEEARGIASCEASTASQLQLQLRTAEAAVRAANLQAESAAVQARAEASATPAKTAESAKLAAELRESANMNSQLKVELACVTQMRDNVQLDLHDEASAAGALRRQLQEAEAAVWRLGQGDGTEVEDLRGRNAELEAEAARHLRVCDRIYEDLAGQTELNSQLKHELAVAHELAKANMDYPANDFDDGERNRLQMRIFELEAEKFEQQSRIIELEALAESAGARQMELEQALEEEMARTAHLQGLLDSQALEQQANMEAAAPVDRSVPDVTAPLAADPGRERQERLLKSLEAEQAKVSRLREALVAAEERAQLAEQARQEAEGAAAAAQAAAPLPDSGARGAGAGVSLRDLAWENAGGLGEAVSEKPTLSRQLSAGSKDRLFQAAAADDIDALRAALRGEEDAVMAVLRARDERGRTLLQVSLANSADEAAKFFLGEGQRWAQRRKFMFQLQGELLERELGRFVNGQDHYGQNALAALCSASSTTGEVLGMLMEAQADPTQRDMAGKTPFIECAKSGNIQVMGALIRASRGGVLADADDANRSPLHWAAQEGHSQAVVLLLKAGADADMADLDGKTAADLARAAGHLEVAQVLAEAMSDDTLGHFLAQESPSGPSGSGGEGYGEDDGEDFEIPQEDSVHSRVPRSFEDDDDDEDSAFVGSRGPGSRTAWASL